MTRKSIDNLLNDACILRRNCDFLLRDARNDGEESLAEHLDGVNKTMAAAVAGLQAASKFVKG